MEISININDPKTGLAAEWRLNGPVLEVRAIDCHEGTNWYEADDRGCDAAIHAPIRAALVALHAMADAELNY